MRAMVYAVKRDFGWEAGVSVAWEVDREYWTNPIFRKQAVEYWEVGGEKSVERRGADLGGRERREEDGPHELAWLTSPLPFGIAMMTRDRLHARWKVGNGNPREDLIEAAHWAAVRAGEPEAVNLRGNLKASVQTEVENGAAATGVNAVEHGGSNDSAAAPFGSDIAGRFRMRRIDAVSPLLALQAREAAERLRGCGLLLTEALAALESEEVMLLPALQLAMLLGGVRFTSAVGPAAGSSGFRWRRDTGAAAMSCRRCGSSGTALRRTPCASCGRQRCAYCETCLTMGRSRECGLLVIGAPATTAGSAVPAPSSGQDQIMTVTRFGASSHQITCSNPVTPANAGSDRRVTCPNPVTPANTGSERRVTCSKSTDEITGPVAPSLRVPARWGLSPAQQEAAEAALAFLLKNGQEATPQRPLIRRGQTRGLLRFLRWFPVPSKPEKREFLLWAVTGAGKTEMMFPLLDAVLSAGGRVAVATPRRDVVLELAPRLAAAFPQARRVVLYGGSEDRFRLGDLTLATTHQLIRFKEAFDLVVIDEVDAFPFHNDPALHYAAAEARARSGMTLLLSATPPPAMQRGARRGRLPHARVAVRHHRQPLPVPQRLAISPLSRWSSQPAASSSGGASAASSLSGQPAQPIESNSPSQLAGPDPRHMPDEPPFRCQPGEPNSPRLPAESNSCRQSAKPSPQRLPAKLREALRASIQRGAQLFVFVPYIRQVEPLVQLLRSYAPQYNIAPAAIDGTSSHDPQRGEKVTAFRNCSIRLLVTTTILERGVTVPKSDVFVLDADKPLFDAASLVQMAGRAGRSADDPYGRVFLAAAAWTQSQRDACKQIREMNAFARRKGYLASEHRQKQ